MFVDVQLENCLSEVEEAEDQSYDISAITDGNTSLRLFASNKNFLVFPVNVKFLSESLGALS